MVCRVYSIPEPAAAIALAEQFDIRSILPVAYYDLLRCTPRKDWGELLEGYCIYNMSDKPARWGCLTAKSLRKLRRLQDILIDETYDLSMYFGTALVEGHRCPMHGSRPGECKKMWEQLVEDTVDLPLRAQERVILSELRRLWTRASKSTICHGCKRVFVKAIDDWRHGTWERIQEVCLEDEDRVFC